MRYKWPYIISLSRVGELNELTWSCVLRPRRSRIQLPPSYQQTYGQRRKHYLPFRVGRLLLSGNCPVRRGTVSQFTMSIIGHRPNPTHETSRFGYEFVELLVSSAQRIMGLLAGLAFISSLLTSTTWAHSFLGACLSCFLGAGGAGNRYRSALGSVRWAV